MGKAALWAGAQERAIRHGRLERIGRRRSGINPPKIWRTDRRPRQTLPYWFAESYQKFANRENDLPVDQHLLIAMNAPRPVYVASAAGDQWSDPHGEFLGAQGAEPVYRLFGVSGLETEGWPATGHPVMKGTIAYHVREGKHAITEYDWEQYMNFADAKMKR